MTSERFLSWLQENLPFGYAFIISIWGGFVQYASRVRQGEPWEYKAMFLDLVICSFTGVITFFICQAAGVQGWQAAAIIAISAHEGTRGIALFINWRDRILGK